MKTIGHHFHALQWTLQQFSKGKYLLYFIPGVLFALLFWWLQRWSEGLISPESVDPNAGWWAGILEKGVSGTGHFLSFIFKQLAVFFVLTLFSPINTFLSEAVDTDLTGERIGFDILRFVNDFIRMIFVVIIAILLELIIMGVWSLFSWMFGIQFLNPTVFFISASFFYGFSFFDYSLERNEISVMGSIRFSKRYAMPTLVTGIFFSTIMLIPILGLALAPVIMTIVSTHVFLKTMGKLDKPTETIE
jgi:CysZ protein